MPFLSHWIFGLFVIFVLVEVLLLGCGADDDVFKVIGTSIPRVINRAQVDQVNLRLSSSSKTAMYKKSGKFVYGENGEKPNIAPCCARDWKSPSKDFESHIALRKDLNQGSGIFLGMFLRCSKSK